MNLQQYTKVLSEARRGGKEVSLTFLGPNDCLPVENQKPIDKAIPPDQRELLDYNTAAEMLSISTQALRDLVYKNKGPAICQVGKRTFFKPEDLKAYADKHRLPEPAPVVLDPIQRTRGRPRLVEAR